MSNVGIWTGVIQAGVVLLGGGWGVWKVARDQGTKDAQLKRIIKQVEPNTGTSLRDDVQKLRDDVTALREDFRRFSADVDRRLLTLERK